MTKSKQELADEQIDVFLKEIGVISPPAQADNEDPSFESLIEEIFETANPSSPSPAVPSLPVLPINGEKKNKRPRSLIWITASLLIGLFTGCTFGFFWAKSVGILDKPIVEPREEISTQISYWISELTNLYDKLEPPASETEIIEPLPRPDEMETLSPSEMT